ncbi:MAG: PBP1A family penicillin-binding protein [Nitrospirae bacterium]|nr:PBP1A family penicillin-binding protein [Nitrospirota bacterium]
MLYTAAALSLITFLYITFLYLIATDKFEGKKWALPSKIYSDSLTLYPGIDINSIDLTGRLRRLNYHRTTSEPKEGEYRQEGNIIDIYLHNFIYPNKPFTGSPVRLYLKNTQIEKMEGYLTKEELFSIEIEPELITAIFEGGWQERSLVKLSAVPKYLTDAIVTIEDRRFYEHFGIDPRAVARAILANIKNIGVAQGGSTITQQLVKNMFLSHKRTFWRKINEAVMAVILDARYSKEEILEAYINEIYLGQRGSVGIFGFGEAARFYFSKEVSQLTLAESALLSGLIRSPNSYSPYVNINKARARRNLVLSKMMEMEKITNDEYKAALSEQIVMREYQIKDNDAPYFVDYVKKQLQENYPESVLTSEGLQIFTTLEPNLQRAGEKALKSGLADLEKRYPSLIRKEQDESLQAAILVIQPQTGYIKAMLGGRNYKITQFNRITQAKRQPGSVFKPVVYLTALTPMTDGKPKFTPSSIIDDSPVTINFDNKDWSPQNYDKKYYGNVTLRTALEKSLNASTVKIAQETGVDNIIATAKALGIESHLQNIPSIALGTIELTPLEIAVAYSTIANSGIRPVPISIKDVIDKDGNVIEKKGLEMEKAASPQAAFVLTHLLKGVVDNGTAMAVRQMGFSRPAAGKTGTTSDYKDAWFVGYTPELLSLVWVGFDEKDVINLSGSQAALPIWTEFMKAAGSTENSDFLPPQGIIFKKVDRKSGLLSNSSCPDSVQEAFIEGTEPTEECSSEKGGIIKWFKGIFEK